MSKKRKLFWQPWFWSDWFNSLDVQTLPKDTRCVWFEMIGLMWLSDERGYLTRNGKPLSDEQVGLLLRTPPEEFKEHLSILEGLELFSRRDDGAIFSRKILRDKDLRDKRSDAGRNGGLATQKQKSVVIHKADEDEPMGAGYPGEPSEEDKLRANELALAGIRE